MSPLEAPSIDVLRQHCKALSLPTAVQIVGGPDKDGLWLGGDYEADSVLGDQGRARVAPVTLLTPHLINDVMVQGR